jgi:5-methylcytosine-specific restriction endonuclease McrA
LSPQETEERREQRLATKRAWYYKNKERDKELIRGQRLRNYIKHRDERLAYARKYKEEHPEYSAEYYVKTKEHQRERSAKWFLEHPELRKFYGDQRRAAKANSPGYGYTTPDLLEARWEMFGRRCYLCGVPATATDHVKPLFAGGSCYPANLRPICGRCNSMKGHKWPYDFNAHRTRIMNKAYIECT